MTPTKDELARLAELEDLLTVGLVEQPINGSVLSWGEAALIAHRIGRHLLRATPVADTAGIDAAWREAEAALPEGWMLDELVRLHGAGFKADAWIAKAIFHDHNAGPLKIAVASTPAAALIALADALRAVPA